MPGAGAGTRYAALARLKLKLQQKKPNIFFMLNNFLTVSNQHLFGTGQVICCTTIMSQTYTCTGRLGLYSIQKSPKTNCARFLFERDRLQQLDLEICRSQQLSHMGADLTQRYRDLDGQMCLFLPSSAFSQQMLETRDQQRGTTRDNKGSSKGLRRALKGQKVATRDLT